MTALGSARGAVRRTARILGTTGVAVRDRHRLAIWRQVIGHADAHWQLGMSRSEYYMFELYRTELSDKARRTFLSQAAWDVLTRLVNHPTLNSDDSTLMLCRRLANAGVPMPATLAYISASPTPSVFERPEFVPLDRILHAIPDRGCVIKPDRSSSGRGVTVFNRSDDRVLYRLDGRRFRLKDLRTNLLRPDLAYLVQERLENHPDLAAIHEPGVASLRLLTYGAPDRVRVASATLKLPIGRQGVDNYAAGGIAAPVALSSGEIGPGVGAVGLDWMSAHPESGQTFAGRRVPLWDDVLSVARRAAEALDDVPCVGWDIAVTPDGPVVIEANSQGGAAVQRPHRQGLWAGDFREWCLEELKGVRVDRSARRWLGLA